MDKKIKILFILLLPNILLAQLSSNSWAYQLQDISIAEIRNNNSFDLIVIDYSHDGTDGNKLSKNEILQIKNSGKKAIAYISIGEAESYRKYWKSEWDADNDGIPDNTAPSWLGRENPNWKGNYKVRYWDPEWQNIIFNYIDTIISQKFDGIYCDIVDGYYYWSEVVKEKKDADTLMIKFLSKIKKHITTRTPDAFYIIPQNGEFIIEEDNVTQRLRDEYFASIDAIGVEDVFFYGNLEEDNPYNPDITRVNVLKKFIQHDKKVFSVEYLTDKNLITQYISMAQQNNFTPYTTKRMLNILSDGIILSVNEQEDNTVGNFRLFQNYPNPFNPSTTIKYEIKNPSFTSLKIYTVVGQEIATLVNKEQRVGTYKVIFNQHNLSSGLYFYQIKSGNSHQTKSMLFVK